MHAKICINRYNFQHIANKIAFAHRLYAHYALKLCLINLRIDHIMATSTFFIKSHEFISVAVFRISSSSIS